MNALSHNGTPSLLIVSASPAQTYALATPVASEPAPFAPVPFVRTIAMEDIVRCILSRWRCAAAAACFAALFVFLLMTGKVPQYAADASLLMRIHDDKIFNFDRVVDNNGEAHSAPFLLNSHRVQLKSRRFLEAFYASLTPIDRADFLAPPDKVPFVARALAALKPAPPPSQLSMEDQRREDFIAMLEPSTVDFIKETFLIKVTARHHRADMAARLANAWVRAYIDYVGQDENSNSLKASAFLRQQAGGLRQKLEEAERRLAACRSRKGLLSDDGQKTGDTEKLKMLSTELAKAELELSRTQESLRQIEAAGGDTEKLITIEALTQAPTVAALRPQFTEKLKEKEIVDAEYGPRHPAWTNFYREFDAMKTEAGRVLRRAINETQNHARSVASQVEAVKNQIAGTSAAVLAQGEDAVEQHMLQSQLNSDRALYDKIISRLNEASVSSAFNEVTHLRPAETAVPPEKPATPNKPLSVILAGFSFLSVFIAVPLMAGLAGVLRKSGRAVLSVERASAGSCVMQGQPIAGPVRAPVSHPVPERHPDSFGGIEVITAVPPLTPQSDGRVDQMLASLFRSGGPVRGSFERMAARIAAAQPAGSNLLLITSRTAGEGKSLTAAALGVACLAHGKSALIIDCNLRRPALHQWLPRQQAGLTMWDIFAAEGKVPLNLQDLRCGSSDLFTLPAGGSAAAPPALFSRPWFGGLLKFLMARVDLVILDAPPLEENSAITLLAPFARHVVITCDKELTSGAQLAEAVAHLNSAWPKLTVAGCVLNDGALPRGAMPA